MRSQEDSEETQKRVGRKALKMDLCRICGVPLMTTAESRLGVHVDCVHKSQLRQRKLSMLRPSYGNRR